MKAATDPRFIVLCAYNVQRKNLLDSIMQA
jgi:hypothetical protein